MSKKLKVREITPELETAIRSYYARFRGDPNDNFSLFDTALDNKTLIARLERAVAENRPYSPMDEEWTPEFRAKVLSGKILI